jgi:hypothetical protein
VKDENGDLLADSHILNTWKNYFSQLLNLHRVNDARHIEINTAELLVPDPSLNEAEIAIAKIKQFKLPNSNQILAEPIQAGDETLWVEIHKLVNSIWIKEDLLDQ